MTHKGRIFHLGLSNKEPIEGIGVMVRKVLKREHVIERDRQDIEPIRLPV